MESAINAVVGKRFGKRLKMQWSKPGTRLLLQTRARTLDGTLREKFEQWYQAWRPVTVALKLNRGLPDCPTLSGASPPVHFCSCP